MCVIVMSIITSSYIVIGTTNVIDINTSNGMITLNRTCDVRLPTKSVRSLRDRNRGMHHPFKVRAFHMCCLCCSELTTFHKLSCFHVLCVCSEFQNCCGCLLFVKEHVFQSK